MYVTGRDDHERVGVIMGNNMGIYNMIGVMGWRSVVRYLRSFDDLDAS